MSDELEYEVGSGNVFADLGREDADEMLARAELLRQINSIIAHRHLTQVQAAELLGTNQPTVSDLKRGRLSKFSLERLIGFLNALDRDVEIVVKRKPRSRKQAHVRVAAA
jgi:predicted XRE-type DNA-binding protein